MNFDFLYSMALSVILTALKDANYSVETKKKIRRSMLKLQKQIAIIFSDDAEFKND